MRTLATKLFDLVEKFAGYGFNKSHSAAYALVSYQTAWLKAHHPAAFMAAVMSSELQNTDKIVILIEECKRMRLTLRLPDINEGEYMFTVNEGGDIVYGLGAIKGLGSSPVEQILHARREGGAFSDLFDFCARTDPRKLNRKAIEALVQSGAFDRLGTERWILSAAIDDALRAAEQNASNRDAGMSDLFGETVEASTDGDDPYAPHRGVRPWTDRERLQGERDTLGLYVTGHPIDEYEEEIRRFAPHRLVDLRPDSRFNCRAAGLVMSLRTMKTARGTMAVFRPRRSQRRGSRPRPTRRSTSSAAICWSRIVSSSWRGYTAQDDRRVRPGDARVGGTQPRRRARPPRLGTEDHVDAAEADDRCATSCAASCRRAGASARCQPALSPAGAECRRCSSVSAGASRRARTCWRNCDGELGRDRVALFEAARHSERRMIEPHQGTAGRGADDHRHRGGGLSPPAGAPRCAQGRAEYRPDEPGRLLPQLPVEVVRRPRRRSAA
jgi:hypothetical protein